jgi:hypothetical protein
MAKDPCTVSRPLPGEVDDLVARRQAAWPGSQPEPAAVEQTLVGLALSAGGVRSASFCLGLLQALYRHDLLRSFDYLSAVSGGGFIGGWLCALFHRGRDAVAEALGQAGSARQTPRVRQLVRGGDYLEHPLRFAQHYLLGLLLNNLALVSGLVLGCAALSWAWRLLDIPPVTGWLLAVSGGWIAEWNRPFLPALALATLWLGTCAVAATVCCVQGRRLPPDWLAGAARTLLALSLVAVLIGLAVWLSTPAIRLGTPADAAVDGRSLSSFTLSRPQQVLWTSLTAFVAASLLPLLRPRDLVEGWLQPTRWYQPYLFFLSSTALLVGVPFLLIFYLAGHDLCGLYQQRRPHLSDSEVHFHTWVDFWRKVESEGVADTSRDKLPVRKDHPAAQWSPQGIPARFTATPSGHIWRVMSKEIVEARQTPTWPACSEAPVPWRRSDRRLKQQLVAIFNEKVIDDPRFNRHAFQPAGRKDWLKRQAAPHPRKDRLLLLASRAEQLSLGPDESQELNRLIVEVCYPEFIWEMQVVRQFVYVPIEPGSRLTWLARSARQGMSRTRLIEADQAARLLVMIVAGVLFLLSAVLVNLNATSLHGFYRDQLREVFLPAELGQRQPLAQLQTTSNGGPYPLFCCTLNRLASLPRMLGQRHHSYDPTAGFLLSPRNCGSGGPAGHEPTARYLRGQLPLDDALAISAAAFTPAAPRAPLLVFLMTALNLRLGQWLPMPNRPPWLPWPSVLGLFLGQFYRPGAQRYALITDGGHHDPLGLWPLLQRRCQVIVVSDATGDPDYQFRDLTRAIRRARVEEGIRIVAPGAQAEDGPLPLAAVRPAGADRLADGHYFLASVLYPEGGEGVLVVLKPTFTGDEPSDLTEHRSADTDFPHDPTENQLFSEEQFDSYRQLGEHTGDAVAAELQRQVRALGPPAGG